MVDSAGYWSFQTVKRPMMQRQQRASHTDTACTYAHVSGCNRLTDSIINSAIIILCPSTTLLVLHDAAAAAGGGVVMMNDVGLYSP